ncbi:hypothetical protein F7725_017770 [Dissostichus mawsoni]|uniref:Methyltransferase domain-containing protein n=1 Tax=Dissostichus mawsoni TaxID=36200 RepID=A0A7J5XQC9_DISMA|nr:hypothetical protein F7725_017770 [Dissostichus mawsoni]
MSDCSRTLDDVKTLLRAFNDTDPQQTKKLYDSWAETYDQDLDLLNYRAPHLAVDFLDDNFPGAREEVQVLDVACGSGTGGKTGQCQRAGGSTLPQADRSLEPALVGVDCSKGMLDQAAKTGRYQDLRLALLGSDPLPAQTGGFVCMARGDHRGSPSEDYGKDLQRELQLMEDEGLWSPAGHKRTLRYMQDPYLSGESIQDLLTEERFLSGTVYLYQKSIQ